MCHTIDAKDKNKDIGTVLFLFHKYLGTSILLAYVFLLILFHYFFFIIQAVLWTT
jgi:hypothetical protein